uniref:DNA-directed DNA polymerase n=1 Tax=Kalanchoe fedtschenkoi TaxID=63787 RepID=A0A7N0ZWS3_KALFE
MVVLTAIGQLALKLISNVTYGYTAAGFSGRMPCVELGDSIGQCGRRTLETAFSFENANETGKAQVIYGDMDSVSKSFNGDALSNIIGISIAILGDTGSVVMLRFVLTFKSSLSNGFKCKGEGEWQIVTRKKGSRTSQVKTQIKLVTLFEDNLPRNINARRLKHMFERFGVVVNA